MGSLITEELVEQVVDAFEAEAVAPATEPLKKKPSNLTITKVKPSAVASEDAKASDVDIIGDIVHKIEKLEKAEALARVGELEDEHEKNYFEIGGVFSIIQREKWFEPSALFDEWVENNTGMKRSKARALIQIYEAIVSSGVKWAQIKHLGWTKVRAIARVLDEENAEHWIGIASKLGKADLIKAVKKDLGGLDAGGSTASPMTFKVHTGQKATIEAAIDKAKAASGTDVKTVALEYICLDYGQTMQQRLAILAPEALAMTFADVLNAMGKDVAMAVIKSVHRNVTHEVDLHVD